MLGNQIAMVSPPHAWELPRRASVAAWRTFNTTLDEVFYDVGALSSGERAGLAAHAAPEGAVLVVHPGASEEPIRRFAPVSCGRISLTNATRQQARSTAAIVRPST